MGYYFSVSRKHNRAHHVNVLDHQTFIVCRIWQVICSNVVLNINQVSISKKNMNQVYIHFVNYSNGYSIKYRTKVCSTLYFQDFSFLSLDWISILTRKKNSMQAWRSPNQGRNNVASRYNREGIYVSHSSRAFRDEEGKNFWVEMEIFDKYRYPSGSQGPYNVTVSLLYQMKLGRIFA